MRVHRKVRALHGLRRRRRGRDFRPLAATRGGAGRGAEQRAPPPCGATRRGAPAPPTEPHKQARQRRRADAFEQAAAAAAAAAETVKDEAADGDEGTSQRAALLKDCASASESREVNTLSTR